MAATHFMYSTASVIALQTPTQSDHKQESLIVVDFIHVTSTTVAAATVTIELDDGANPVYTAQSTLAANSSDTYPIDFGDGFPLWKVKQSGSDWISTSAPATLPNLNVSHGDGGGSVVIGYHYERPSLRR